MRLRWIECMTVLCIVGSSLMSGRVVNAQSSPDAQSRGTFKGPQLAVKNHLAELSAYADALAKRCKVRIMIDPGIFVATDLTAPEENMPLEKAMNVLTYQVKNTTWRRVYVQQTQTKTLPAPEKLAYWVRTLEQLEHSSLILENPTTQRAISYMKNYATPSVFNDDLIAKQFSTSPVYLLYSTKPDARPNSSLPERFADLQRQQMEMLLQMNPDQISQGVAQAVHLLQGLDPDTRSRVIGNAMGIGMQAYTTLWQDMSPEERQNMMHQIRQFFGAAPGPSP